MSKFRVGDTVVITRPVDAWHKGKLLEVLAIDETKGLYVRWHEDNVKQWQRASKFDLHMLAPPTERKSALPLDSAERKRWPLYSGLLAYFPAALAQVANHSFIGNEKHNPGLPLQHARGVSSDHKDCIIRHLMDAMEHPQGSAQRVEELRALCWRGLALLQEESELAGAPAAPAATFDRSKK